MRTATPGRTAQAGFTIVEMLVAVALSMAMTLAISMILVRHDGERRSLSSNNDAQLNGHYLSYLIDRAVRSAGSGFIQGWNINLGCAVQAARNGQQILPRPAGFPAPFGAVSGTWRLAPVVVHAGAGEGGSDVLAIAVGTSGMAEAASRVLPGSAGAATVSVATTVGFRGNDLVLLAESGQRCMVQQVAAPFTGGATQPLAMGGTYAAGTINGQDLADYTGAANLTLLGNASDNPPQFQFLGIGAQSRLYSYDILRMDGSDTPRPIADGVVDLRVRYGVDTDGDNVIDAWVLPSAAGYAASDLLDGSDAARDRLMTIRALRIGLIVRADRIEKTAVSPETLTLFDDLGSGLAYQRTLSADEQRMRYRTLDFTVPLRNVIHQKN